MMQTPPLMSLGVDVIESHHIDTRILEVPTLSELKTLRRSLHAKERSHGEYKAE